MSLEDFDRFAIAAGRCPWCGGVGTMDVNQWQAWCYVCDWQSDDLGVVDELRAVLGRPPRIGLEEAHGTD